jgi:hypothetical protein
MMMRWICSQLFLVGYSVESDGVMMIDVIHTCQATLADDEPCFNVGTHHAPHDGASWYCDEHHGVLVLWHER